MANVEIIHITSGASRPAPRSLEDRLLSDEYRVAPETFWAAANLRGDDGYDRIQVASNRGWTAIPSRMGSSPRQRVREPTTMFAR